MKSTTKIITADDNKRFISFTELKRFKDLFWVLAWRDYKVRYAQTTLGFLWAILQPVLTLTILALVFSQLNESHSKTPNLIFVLCGLSIWTYFSFVLINSGSSLIQNQGMIKKIYFPRIIVPFSKAIVGLIDLGITLVLLVILLIYFRFMPGPNIWLAPVFILLSVITSLGIGLWISALTVRFRDFQHVLPFLVQIGLYASPVAYDSRVITSRLPGWAADLYYLNPIAGIIEGFRWSIVGGTFHSAGLFISIGVGSLIFISGLFYFNKIEKDIADYV